MGTTAISKIFSLKGNFPLELLAFCDRILLMLRLWMMLFRLFC
ncbi:hypothetical protein [uncultured Cohaesibacter sp.]|nr:hypothetical protein [uncultured Cohaesibacter sp.]